MLARQDCSKTPSQARHVGPPGEVPSNCPAKGVLAGEARRPTKRGPHLAEAQSCQISPTERPSARRGTSAHQARALMNPKIGREGWEKKTDRAVGQSKPTCHGRIQESVRQRVFAVFVLPQTSSYESSYHCQHVHISISLSYSICLTAK